MTNKREELVQRNKNFVQIPMPELSKMTDEELERRSVFLEKYFDMAFDEDDCEVKGETKSNERNRGTFRTHGQSK